ncbi:MAG: serine/threonine protein kinase [Planctomycetota bacterium]|nr:MAG: serine/threonine protein kinase [Planctomycetota bacterium]
MGEVTAEDRAFSRLALKNGFLTRDQVKDVFREIRAAEDHVRFEDLVVAKKYLSNEQASAVGLAYRRLRKDNEKKKWQIKGYEIYSKLGEGGLGVVLKAKQESMNRLVALKILHKRWLDDEEFKQRFLVEARLVGKLSHQNLIKVYDVGREDWKLYFSMEYVEGETLEQIIEREGPLDTVRAIDLTMQVLRAIRYISRFDIVHCDIKPSNILVTHDGVAKLGDFGFVKSNIDIEVTEEGSVLGTPDYISPEQAMGREVDFRSDIYSLGITLFHMVAKKPPFDGTVSTIMRAHIREDLPSLRKLNPEVPEALVRVIQKMTAKNPSDRYGSCEELFEELEAIKLKEKTGQGGELGRAELLEALRLEKDKVRQRQLELYELRQRLQRMTLLFWSVAGVAALAAVICCALALRLAGQAG